MFRKKTMITCEYQDIENVMQKLFGRRVSFLEFFWDHPRNDSWHTESAIRFDTVSEYDTSEWANMTRRHRADAIASVEAFVASLDAFGRVRGSDVPNPGVEVLLSYLVEKGVLEEGEYSIEISW
jgi:hypothetical protein